MIVSELFENTSDHDFMAWFAGSKVVDTKGKPLKVFHGTHATFKLPFKEFTHFGTPAAANQRLYGRAQEWMDMSDPEYLHTMNVMRRGARIYPVYLRILKPYRFTDMKNNGYGDILRSMLRKNIATIDEIESLRATKLKGWQNGNFLHEECGKFIIDKLSRLGYDGLVYRNQREDAGNESWVTFRPDQIRHA